MPLAGGDRPFRETHGGLRGTTPTWTWRSRSGRTRRPAPPPGFSRTEYEVARSNLQGTIRLRILRGGVQQGAAPRIPTEPVVCNDATLIIGAQPQYSFFYGDLLGGTS